MKRIGAFLLLALAASGAFVFFSSETFGCGPLPVIRTYLERNFWQPLTRGAGDLFDRGDRPAPIGQPFAGFGPKSRDSALEGARAAYRPLADGCPDPEAPGGGAGPFARARRAIAQARQGKPAALDAAELTLLEAKIDLREAECQGNDTQLLSRSRQGLESVLSLETSPALASEARGWLGRVLYLSGDHVRAAKIYLDELLRPESIHTRDSLLLSLRMLYPHDGTYRQLSTRLEEFFDTPEHALFALTLVTNPREDFEESVSERKEIARKVEQAVKRHPELFGKGESSDRVALALMRAALFAGDQKGVLRYARRVARGSRVAESPDFLWFLGAAHHLEGNHQEAAKAFRSLVRTKTADTRFRMMGWQGLAVSAGFLGNNPEKLDALLHHWVLERQSWESETTNSWDFSLFCWRDSKDLAYALDVELPVEALETYLAGNWASQKLEFWHYGPGRDDWRELKYSGRALVAYSLAVRYARLERYADASRLYEKAGSPRRLRRMEALSAIYASASSAGGGLEAKLAYAEFLSKHSTQVFFNDRLWGGMQRYVLEGPENEDGEPVPAAESATAARDREFLDAQEEYWRAALVCREVARTSDDPLLKRRAASTALSALARIRLDRFRREKEIREMKKEFLAIARNSSGAAPLALLFPGIHADTSADPELQAFR
ncbi:MAG: hypothetical protein IT186_02465 [Acidobacteria bacterium]|nr:hypothetical protein [Acidobacteriota bacterium]